MAEQFPIKQIVKWLLISILDRQAQYF